jgi:apolipoprotein N-acyltransferase
MTLWSRVAWPWFLLGWIGLVPWLAALDAADRWWTVFVRGVAMSVAFTIGVFWWFGLALAAYADWPGASGLVLLVLVAPLLQPQFVALALARHAVRGSGAVARALACAGAYVGCEWLVPKLLGDTLGHGFLASRAMRQAADLFGAPGLTAALVCANEAVLAGATAFRRGDRGRVVRAAGVLGLLVVALAAYGRWRLASVERGAAVAAPVTMGVVQGGLGLGDYRRLRASHGAFEATRRILNAYFAQSEEALARGEVRLLVWPETVYPTTFGSPKSADGAAFDRALAAFVARTGVPLVFGGYDHDERGREYNAAIVLEPPRGQADVTFDAYRKTWLFPLTERVPPWLDGPALRDRLPWLGTWAPGDGPTVLNVDVGGAVLPIAPLVCYDAVVPAHAAAAVAAGARLLVTLSNDSWFGDGPGTWLHLTVSAFRSIETRRPQVRATTTGISAIVDATGEIREAIAGGAGTLVDAVRPAALPATLAMRLGDWLSPGLLVLAAVFVVAAQRGGRSR